MAEEREVEYVLIDNKKYEVVMEKASGDTTYMYLSNLDDDNDMDGCMEHLVLCKVDHGFGYTEYYEAMKILKIEK